MGAFLKRAIKMIDIVSNTPESYLSFDWHEYEKYKKKFVHKMQEYYENNYTILEEYLKKYETAISNEFFESNYVLLNEKKLRSVLSRCKVMVLTANPIEKAIFHFEISQKTKRKNTAHFLW